MKRWTLGLVIGTAMSALAFASPANAAFTLTLDDTSTVGIDVSITDNGAGDGSATAGVIVFNGAVGSFGINVTTGISKPVIGPSHIDLNSVNVTTNGAGNLVMTLTDDGFVGTGPALFLTSIGGTLELGATLNVSSSANGTNVSNMSFGPGGAFSSAQSGIANLSTPYALQVVVDLTHTQSGVSSFDAELRIPEPSTLAVFGIGLIALGGMVMRRKKAVA